MIVLSLVLRNSLRRRSGFVGVWAVGEACVAALVKAALGGGADRNLMFVNARLPGSGSGRCKETHKFISVYLGTVFGNTTILNLYLFTSGRFLGTLPF